MKFIVSYFYEEDYDCLDYIEVPTMKAAVDYAKEKAHAQFLKLVETQLHAPFVMSDDFELVIDQKIVRDQMENQISYSVEEFDPDNDDHVMIMFACKGEDEYV